MLDNCLRDNNIAPLCQVCLTLLGTCAKWMQFYCPSRTHPAIPYCTIFIIFSPQCIRYIVSKYFFDYLYTTFHSNFFRPINDIDLPELPDFLKPESTSKRPLRPIQDIDLPDGTGVIQPDEDELAEEEEHNHNKEEGNNN